MTLRHYKLLYAIDLEADSRKQLRNLANRITVVIFDFFCELIVVNEVRSFFSLCILYRSVLPTLVPFLPVPSIMFHGRKPFEFFRCKLKIFTIDQSDDIATDCSELVCDVFRLFSIGLFQVFRELFPWDDCARIFRFKSFL